MGIVIVVAAVAAGLAANRDGLWTRLSWAAACWLATLLTPLGFENWRQIVASIGRSYANGIHEWQPTPWPPQHLAFWGVAVLLAASDGPPLEVSRAAGRSGADRGRHPCVSARRQIAAQRADVHDDRRPGDQPPAPLRERWWRRAFRPATGNRRARTTGRRRGGPHRRHGRRRHGVAPTVAPARLAAHRRREAEAIAACPGPLYNTYESGGPIIWFVPSQPVFIDSRQDPFPIPFVQAATDRRGDRRLRGTVQPMAHQLRRAASGSPTAARLAGDGWLMRFSDPRWTVLERPAAATTPATPSPAP